VGGLLLPGGAGAGDVLASLAWQVCSVYLLYWYKGTNTGVVYWYKKVRILTLRAAPQWVLSKAPQHLQGLQVHIKN